MIKKNFFQFFVVKLDYLIFNDFLHVTITQAEQQNLENEEKMFYTDCVTDLDKQIKVIRFDSILTTFK